MSDKRPQTYAEASAELASAMQAVEEANASFFAAFKAAGPLLRSMGEESVKVLVARWDDWNQKRKLRDRLKDKFRTRFHEAR